MEAVVRHAAIDDDSKEAFDGCPFEQETLEVPLDRNKNDFEESLLGGNGN